MRSRDCFNPLHCGAVVASTRLWVRQIGLRLVSIPFIAGQWSLRETTGSDVGMEPRFNPLHCGAVVASVRRCASDRRPAPRFNPLHCGAVVASGSFSTILRKRLTFQSPSLRGSGRFLRSPYGGRMRRRSFNPLHCGAVVASPSSPLRSPYGGRFNPLHCGAVVASTPEEEAMSHLTRFNPLHCGAVVASRGADRGLRRGGPRFNPLHCGAVVASEARAPPLQRGPQCFNPLHCGAVVASIRFVFGIIRKAFVSIPFIAGQWSLLAPRPPYGEHGGKFQSPSLRGSGRFGGANCAGRRRGDDVSIPFIAGQWSLPNDADQLRKKLEKFQSPSLRGSGRFPPPHGGGARRRSCFNPLHCGAVVASWSRDRGRQPTWSFNPLHCGAVVASVGKGGQRTMEIVFQSPSLRGSGRFGELSLTN